jgi:hypothetical protein
MGDDTSSGFKLQMLFCFQEDQTIIVAQRPGHGSVVLLRMLLVYLLLLLLLFLLLQLLLLCGRRNVFTIAI